MCMKLVEFGSYLANGSLIFELKLMDHLQDLPSFDYI
jgi:hypothetical protein